MEADSSCFFPCPGPASLGGGASLPTEASRLPGEPPRGPTTAAGTPRCPRWVLPGAGRALARPRHRAPAAGRSAAPDPHPAWPAARPPRLSPSLKRPALALGCSGECDSALFIDQGVIHPTPKPQTLPRLAGLSGAPSVGFGLSLAPVQLKAWLCKNPLHNHLPACGRWASPMPRPPLPRDRQRAGHGPRLSPPAANTDPLLVTMPQRHRTGARRKAMS